jgi:hypothetical protein
MQAKSKVETFIGFAVRANKYRTGMNSVETLKRANLVLVCSTASENTKKQALKASKKLHAKIYITIKPLAELVHKENAKVMAVTDSALAKAIVENAEGELTIFNQENIYG